MFVALVVCYITLPQTFFSNGVQAAVIDKSRNAIRKMEAENARTASFMDNMTEQKNEPSSFGRKRKNNELLKHNLAADYDEFYDDYEAPIITIRFRRSLFGGVEIVKRETVENEISNDTSEISNDTSEISNDTSEISNDSSVKSVQKAPLPDASKNMLVKNRGNEINIRNNGTNAVKRRNRRMRNGKNKKSNRALRRSLRKSRRRQKNKV